MSAGLSNRVPRFTLWLKRHRCHGTSEVPRFALHSRPAYCRSRLDRSTVTQHSPLMPLAAELPLVRWETRQ